MKNTNKLSNLHIDWKKIAPFLVALVAFIAVAMIYCSPILDGKVLHAGDVDNWKGAANEAREYYQQHGERTWWTNSMFSGMPTYQVTGSLPSGDVRTAIADTAHLGMTDQNPIGIIFAYFVGFFLMLICFGVNPWLSIIGALAIGMSSYFFLIIPAGHITKACALGFLAPVIGGFYAIMRKRYWLGIPMVLVYGFLGSTLHPQMTYYMGLMLGIFVCAELFIYGKDRHWKQLGISLGVLVLCALLILGTKWSWMSMNNSYLKQTMRGGHSELTQKNEEGKEKQPASGGLSLKYVTDWSYGIDETMTLLVPNMMGGASHYDIGPDSHLGQSLEDFLAKHRISRKQANQYIENLCKYSPSYHGDKPFTSGAVYVGAVICFLFILGLIIVPGPYKWALLVATLMSIFLAWGRHMMWLTELFYNYFPMYNKFRAVESILVVAEVTMPLLGFLGLQKIISGEVDWKKLHRSLIIAGSVTAGICLAIGLSAKSINMSSSYDRHIFEERNGEIVMVQRGSVDGWVEMATNGLKQSNIPLTQEEINNFKEDCHDAIHADRADLLKADAWRSFFFVIAGFLIVFGFAWLQHSFGNKFKYKVGLILVLIGIILADMIPINKRFFNKDNFITQKELDEPYKVRPWEKEILKDKSLNYRVYNMTANIDQDARTSYRLKSLGGYSAVKLRRYQDLINAHISHNNFEVINMLNTKYLIHPQYGVVPNPDAMGNAWFVDNVQFVPTPDDESNALYTLDLKKTAVADEKFRDVLTCNAIPNESDVIMLTEYQPNKLTYTASNTNDRVAVFSEIYYPEDWHLYIDGQEAKIGRVNYVLRAAVIPAGEHTIVMEFVPSALQKDKASYAFVIILLLIALGSITYPLWKNYLPEKIKALLAKAQ